MMTTEQRLAVSSSLVDIIHDLDMAIDVGQMFDYFQTWETVRHIKWDLEEKLKELLKP